MSGDGNERSRSGGSRSSDPRLAEQERVERENEASAEEASRMRLMGAMHRRWVQRKAKGDGQGSAAIPQSTGRPLADDVRARMEPSLGADLSSVRLHTGGESNSAAEQFGARAFTVGTDVHSRAGEFAPGSKEGDRLLAHELTHVVQGQRSGIQRKAADHEDAGAQQGGAGKDDHDHVSNPDEPAEKEADQVADGVADKLHGGSEKDGAASGGSAHASAAHGGDGAKHQAPPIGAKLSAGVGRKIFRSPNKGKDAKPAAQAPVASSATPGDKGKGPAKPTKASGPQKTSDIEQLYKDAAVAQAALGGLAQGIAQQCHGQPLVPGLKGRGRAMEKINADYGGDASKITDLARASIVFKKPDDIKHAVKQVQERAKVVRMKDRFASPADGYRDVMFNLEMANGHVCELQLQLEAIQQVKDGDGHKLYEKIRTIEAKARLEKRQPNDAEKKQIATLKAQMKGTYDAAFDASQKGGDHGKQ